MSMPTPWRSPRHDVVLFGNDDSTLMWPVVDRETGESITSAAGWSARVQVRSRQRDGDLMHEWKTSDGSAEFVTEPDGTIALMLFTDDSAKWTWRKGFYDIALLDYAGNRHLLAYGRMTYRPGVTR